MSLLTHQKKAREATCLRGLTIGCLGGVRVPIDIDPHIGRASVPNHAQFVSYLGVLAHSRSLF